MKKRTRLMLYRFWGCSIGLFVGLFGADRPLWIKIVIIIPFVYFMVFGDTHFKEDKNDKRRTNNKVI